MRTNLCSWVVGALVAGGAVVLADAVPAQGWKPERNVELTIPTSPGGSNDIAGRTIHKLWGELKLLPVASAVVNRSGGEHIVAYTFIQSRTGDPHLVGLMSTPMLLNPIGGRTQLTHNDLTPIAYLITEPMVAVVRADSPIKTGKDLVIARALAVVHAELVLIHPFREGNGRCARLLALLMAFQADLPPLDFRGWSGKGERNYVAAIHAALSSNYEPMVGLFSEVIRRSYDRFGRRGR